MYEEIVGRGGVSPAHFFYDMTFGEAAAYLRGFEKRDRQEWNRARMIAGAMGVKIEFPWDNEDKEVVIDENEVKDLRERIKKVKI